MICHTIADSVLEIHVPDTGRFVLALRSGATGRWGKGTLTVSCEDLPPEFIPLVAAATEHNLYGHEVQGELGPLIDFILETPVHDYDYILMQAALAELVEKHNKGGAS